MGQRRDAGAWRIARALRRQRQLRALLRILVLRLLTPNWQLVPTAMLPLPEKSRDHNPVRPAKGSFFADCGGAAKCCVGPKSEGLKPMPGSWPPCSRHTRQQRDKLPVRTHTSNSQPHLPAAWKAVLWVTGPAAKAGLHALRCACEAAVGGAALWALRHAPWLRLLLQLEVLLLLLVRCLPKGARLPERLLLHAHAWAQWAAGRPCTTRRSPDSNFDRICAPVCSMKLDVSCRLDCKPSCSAACTVAAHLRAGQRGLQAAPGLAGLQGCRSPASGDCQELHVLLLAGCALWLSLLQCWVWLRYWQRGPCWEALQRQQRVKFGSCSAAAVSGVAAPSCKEL